MVLVDPARDIKDRSHSIMSDIRGSVVEAAAIRGLLFATDIIFVTKETRVQEIHCRVSKNNINGGYSAWTLE